mmetsp:Transcript_48846/g.58911  ORF Transcript_48846/g.58911 Transcript_48846/m.58911 type:complete len:114 (-) Transcript_48846:3979-4320(-)
MLITSTALEFTTSLGRVEKDKPHAASIDGLMTLTSSFFLSGNSFDKIDWSSSSGKVMTSSSSSSSLDSSSSEAENVFGSSCLNRPSLLGRRKELNWALDGRSNCGGLDLTALL